MVEGWIFLHRKLQECEIWANSQPFDMRSAWVDLLLLANHRDAAIIFDYEPMTVKRGQYLTSVRKLSARWNWSKNRTLKYLRLLESLGMIHRESNNQRTLITIDNYSIYQDMQDTGEDTKRTQVGTQSGHEADTGMPQTNNEKNEKNNKNNNRAFVKPTLEEVKAYCLERNNTVDPEAFISFYESKGWMIGKNRMKDWKAAVRTWERTRKETGQGKAAPKKNKFDNFEQREYDYDALMKELTETEIETKRR